MKKKKTKEQQLYIHIDPNKDNKCHYKKFYS